jgi:hypothetical protein
MSNPRPWYYSVPFRGLGFTDVHLSQDDGTNLRDSPWGRGTTEVCHGTSFTSLYNHWQAKQGYCIMTLLLEKKDDILEELID